MKSHPYNLGRWPGQTAPLIDPDQLRQAAKRMPLRAWVKTKKPRRVGT